MNNVDIAQSLGRIEGKLDEALKADRARLDKLEAAQTRQWWLHAATGLLAPVLVTLHAIARKLGVNV
jgi:hypothetical protein